MFTKDQITQDFTCPECGDSILPQWQESAPDSDRITCGSGHATGKTVGAVRQELWRIGMQRAQSILSGKADTLPH